jgi:multidrug efflux pump subunit AcrA (membrane-fusion protein)
MQATYKLQRSSGGIVGAAMVFLAALILGGAGGYLLKSATSVSVTTTTVRSIPVTVAAPSSAQVNTDTSGESRRHFRLAN